MKSQILLLVLLIIGTILFQPTYQYRLSRRELTEYDLTSFIVNTCSLDQTDALVQGLCDQTLQSALLGNFPFLIYYCKTIGAGTRYCKNINQYMTYHQELGAKQQQYTHRRFARSMDRKKKFHQKNFDMNTETALHETQIMQICITKSEESSARRDEFCNQTLAEIQQGRYPEIKQFCKYHLRSDFCRRVRFDGASSSRSSLISSPRSFPAHFGLSDLNPAFDSAAVLPAKPSLVEQ